MWGFSSYLASLGLTFSISQFYVIPTQKGLIHFKLIFLRYLHVHPCLFLFILRGKMWGNFFSKFLVKLHSIIGRLPSWPKLLLSSMQKMCKSLKKIFLLPWVSAHWLQWWLPNAGFNGLKVGTKMFFKDLKNSDNLS